MVTVTNRVSVEETTTPWSERRNLLFVGFLGTRDSPNVDSVRWFSRSSWRTPADERFSWSSLKTVTTTWSRSSLAR